MKTLIDEYSEQVARSQGIILDSNVALLYVIGLISPNLISKHDRTSGFRPNGFWTLDGIIQRAKALFTIPHTLTEVSNLGGRSEWIREVFRATFRPIEELSLKSIQGFDSEFFSAMGLTDAMLFEIANLNYLVVAIDHTLYSCITARGKPCINFTYLQERVG